MRPVIGILTCGYMEKRQFVTDAYVRSIRISGGLPLLIPAQPPETDVAPYLFLCDGFLLPGGGDITPLLQDEDPVNGIGVTNLMLDVYQIRFAEEALATGKPVLGICRGMQVMNAACGGTLFQDISLQPGSPLLHMQTSESRSDASHKVIVDEGSLLYSVTGSSLYTNSFHHQTIRQPGKRMIPTAHALDDTIEAIEMEGHPFAVGVQWHPEAMFFSSLRMRNLFSFFIKTCEKNKSNV